MTKVKAALTAVLVLWASIASAQTTTATQLAWDVVGASLVDVQGYTIQVTVNGAIVTAGPACNQVGPDVSCSVPVPNFLPSGNTVSITHTKGDESAQTIMTGLKAGGLVKSAARPRVKVTVTINVQ